MGHFIDFQGNYLGFYDELSAPSEKSYTNLGDNAPSFGDQVWQFPGWSESPSHLIGLENAWRDQQMPIARNNVTAIQFGDEEVPGTEQQWKDYWLALRKWTTDNPDFPDMNKRPIQPS